MSGHPIPDGALSQHIAILGKTRSGKSSVARLLVEGMLDAKRPVCIVDPKGDWWGLKSSADGKHAGYPVIIFGGEHADVPINAHAGAHVAELVATGNRPCIIDLGGWMTGERTRFWIEFASTLFRLTRGMRWLVVDEAHNFAPKGKIMDPDSGKALHWMNRLASEGLGKGVHMIFASQRPQKVHNDTLTSAETLIAMRVLHPSDRGAVTDWIKGCGDLEKGNEVLQSLADMKRGEGWVWSPEIGFGPKRIQFPMFKTYDSFKAQGGDATTALKGWAAVDLDEVRTKLAAVVEEAKANDPRLLKAEIARLKAELAKAEKRVVDPKALDDARTRGFNAGRDAGLDAARDIQRRLAPAVKAAIEAAAGLADAHDAVKIVPASPARPSVQSSGFPKAPSQVKSVARPAAPAGNGALPGPHQRIVDAIAWWMVAAGAHPTRAQVAFFAGYKPNTGTFNTYLGALSTAGLIEYPEPSRLSLTNEGAALASAPESPSLELLWRQIRGVLSGPQCKLFDALLERGEPMTREALATATGYAPNTGTFNTYLGSLSTAGLIVYPARGSVALAAWARG